VVSETFRPEPILMCCLSIVRHDEKINLIAVDIFPPNLPIRIYRVWWDGSWIRLLNNVVSSTGNTVFSSLMSSICLVSRTRQQPAQSPHPGSLSWFCRDSVHVLRFPLWSLWDPSCIIMLVDNQITQQECVSTAVITDSPVAKGPNL